MLATHRGEEGDMPGMMCEVCDEGGGAGNAKSGPLGKDL